jgi:hypothetical protein
VIQLLVFAPQAMEDIAAREPQTFGPRMNMENPNQDETSERLCQDDPFHPREG